QTRCGRVPRLDLAWFAPVTIARYQHPSVRRKSQRPNVAFVRFEIEPRFACREVPGLKRAVTDAGGNSPAVRRDRHAAHLRVRGLQRGGQSPRPHLPQLDRAVRTAGDEPLTIRADDDAVDPRLVPAQR